MSTSTVKARHYAALSSSLRRLHQELADAEANLSDMTLQLQSMQRLGVYCASQFMATSRLLDDELKNDEETRLAEEAQEVESQAAKR